MWMHLRRALAGTCLAALLLTTSCSHFAREWRQAPASTGDPLAGRWTGFWKSDRTGHQGRLRCILQPLGPDEYRAYFEAKYKGILTFSYPVELHVTSSNSLYHFVGEADLGKLAGGKYQYQGEANQNNFRSGYRSRYDEGTFHLGRLR